MPAVQQNSPAYPVQSPTQSPVSPFAKSTGSVPPSGPGMAGDQLQTQPLARGIQPNINLLKEGQSVYSPFRPKDQRPPETPATPGPKEPSAPKPPDKIVFTFPVDIPDGPADANIQQMVMQAVQQVQHPQQALQLIDNHINQAKEIRETSNRMTWGARYYAVQAAESAEQAIAQWGQMNPQQKQAYISKIHEYRDQAISLLNEAKKHGISTYNEALKANLIYNHFFTGAGTMINVLDDNAINTVKQALNEGWSRWNGSFEKPWQGQTVQAKGILPILDETTNEVTQHLHRMNSVLSQLQ